MHSLTLVVMSDASVSSGDETPVMHTLRCVEVSPYGDDFRLRLRRY